MRDDEDRRKSQEQRPRRPEEIETDQGTKSLTSGYCPRHNIRYPKGEMCPLCH